MSVQIHLNLLYEQKSLNHLKIKHKFLIVFKQVKFTFQLIIDIKEKECLIGYLIFYFYTILNNKLKEYDIKNKIYKVFQEKISSKIFQPLVFLHG